jgi:DNA-binding MarR family transcriptional regulator
MASPKPFNLYDNTGYWVNRLAMGMREKFERELTRFGVTPPHFGLMIVLHRGEARTPLQIARHIGHHGAAITRHLEKLVRMGLVARKPDPADRRSVTLELTPKGRRLITKLIPVARKLNTSFTRRLASTERERFLKTVRDIVKDLDDSRSPLDI